MSLCQIWVSPGTNACNVADLLFKISKQLVTLRCCVMASAVELVSAAVAQAYAAVLIGHLALSWSVQLPLQMTKQHLSLIHCFQATGSCLVLLH